MQGTALTNESAADIQLQTWGYTDASRGTKCYTVLQQEDHAHLQAENLTASDTP